MTRTITVPRRLPPDLGEQFNAGEAGHERIEREALARAGLGADQIAAVYFGNWQRDMSQVLAPVLPTVFGGRTRFVCDLLFDVVDVMAEAKFRRPRPHHRSPPPRGTAGTAAIPARPSFATGAGRGRSDRGREGLPVLPPTAQLPEVLAVPEAGHG